MSIRPVKRVIKIPPDHGRCRRAACGAPSASAIRASTIRSCCSTTSATTARPTTRPAFPGTRTAASRPSPTSWPARSTTPTAWATGARLGAGDVQWMTAGRGILHQEMPQGDAAGPDARLPALGQPALGAEDDRAPLPGRQGQPRSPRSSTTTARWCASSAASSGAGAGPVDGIAAEPRYLDVSVPPGKRKTLPVETERSAFAYVFAGSGSFADASRAAWRPDREGGRRPGDPDPRAHRQPLAGPVRPRRRGHRPGRRGGHPLPAGLRQADPRAGRLVRPDRHEHARPRSSRPWPSCATARFIQPS